MSFVDLFTFRELSAASVASWRLVGRIVVEIQTVKGTDASGEAFEFSYTEWEDREFSVNRDHGDRSVDSSCQTGASKLD